MEMVRLNCYMKMTGIFAQFDKNVVEIKGYINIRYTENHHLIERHLICAHNFFLAHSNLMLNLMNVIHHKSQREKNIDKNAAVELNA